MGVVAKLFISNRSENPDGSYIYNLGAVCRGEENKHWAAATPGGSMKAGNEPILDKVWAGPLKEVEVTISQDSEGLWFFETCAFQYGGCSVAFKQKGAPYGSLTLTINASAATQQLREAFAESLIQGAAAAFRISFNIPA